MCGEPRLETGLVLWRAQHLCIAFVEPQGVDQRFRFIQQARDGTRAVTLDEVVRVHAGGQPHDPQRMGGAQEGKGAGNRAHRGPLSGTIAIEAQYRCLDHAPQHLDLPLGERGAERGNGILDARIGEGDHVHVAFDHDDPA